MEMTMENSDFTTYDLSSQESGPSFFSQVQILTPVLLGLFMGPGVASGVRSTGVTCLPDQTETQIIASAAVPASDLVTTIREGWKLNMTELSGVLGVSRPTLYNWLKGGPVADSKALHHLQVLAVAAESWRDYMVKAGQDFLLDYTGPQANDESIRQAMGRQKITVDELREMVRTRGEQYREAREQSRVLLGDPLPLPASPPPESSRRLNKQWAENAKALHAARNRNR
jgi:DNA-binding transcriptional regulator YiaG